MLGYWGNNNHFHKKKQLSFDTLLGKVKKTRQIVVEGKPFPRSKTQKRCPQIDPKVFESFIEELHFLGEIIKHAYRSTLGDGTY